MTADPAARYRAVTPGQGRTRRPRPAPLFPVWLPPHRTMREAAARRHPHGRAGRLYCDGHP